MCPFGSCFVSNFLFLPPLVSSLWTSRPYLWRMHFFPSVLTQYFNIFSFPLHSEITSQIYSLHQLLGLNCINPVFRPAPTFHILHMKCSYLTYYILITPVISVYSLLITFCSFIINQVFPLIENSKQLSKTFFWFLS